MTAVEDELDVAVEFGRRLRAIRLAAGLTLESLGEAAGMTYQNLGRFERGERTPSFETLLRLAAALDVSLDAFKPDAPFPAPSEEPEPPPRPMGKRK